VQITIIETSAGPLIKQGETHTTIMDTQDMIDLCEGDDKLLERLREHIGSVLEAAVGEIIEGLNSNINPMPQKVYAYINSIQQFLQFKNNAWVGYVQARDAVQSPQ